MVVAVAGLVAVVRVDLPNVRVNRRHCRALVLPVVDVERAAVVAAEQEEQAVVVVLVVLAVAAVRQVLALRVVAILPA